MSLGHQHTCANIGYPYPSPDITLEESTTQFATVENTYLPEFEVEGSHVTDPYLLEYGQMICWGMDV